MSVNKGEVGLIIGEKFYPACDVKLIGLIGGWLQGGVCKIIHLRV